MFFDCLTCFCFGLFLCCSISCVFVICFMFSCCGTFTLWRSLHKQSQVAPPVAPSAWEVNRPKKGPEYYEAQKEKYKESISGNELLNIPSVFDAVSHRMISLLTLDVKTRWLISVSREIMEEVLKSLSISLKIVARNSNVMWDGRQGKSTGLEHPHNIIGEDAN